MTTKQITLKTLTALFAISMLSFSSCKKDDDDDITIAPVVVPPPTKTELLTGKNWKLTAATISPLIEFSPGVFVSDWYAQLLACEKDDLMNFSSNGTYVADAKILCATEPATTTGTWVFNSDQTIVTTDPSTANSESFTIIQLDATTFKGTYTWDFGTGILYTLTATYTKQ